MALREGFIFLLSHYLVLDLLTLLRYYPNRTVTLKVKGTVILLRDCSSESKKAHLQPGPYSEFEDRQRQKIPLYSCCPLQASSKSVMGCRVRAVDFWNEREWRSSTSPQRGREMMAAVMEKGSHRVQVNAWTLKAPGRSQTVRWVGTV